MPIQKIKDSQTGEEREVYVPKGLLSGAQPAPAPKPKQQQTGPFSGPLSLLNETPMGMQMAAYGNAANSLSAAFQEFQRTGDLGKAYAKGVQTQIKGLEGPGAARTATRATANMALGAAQEVSDAAQELFLGKKTTKENPNLPFLGVLPPLQKARSNGPIEDAVTNIGQWALGFVAASRLGGAAGSRLTAVPSVAKATSGLQAAKTAYQGAKAAQLAKISSPALQAAAKVGIGAGEIAASAVAGKGAVAGAVADIAFVDQHEGRLVDTLDSVTKYFTGHPLQGPVFDYLKSGPGDAGAEGRLKNGLDGMFGNSVVELGMRMFRAAKATYRYVNAPEADKAEAAAEVAQAQQAVRREVNKQANTVPDEAPPFDPYQQAREYTPQWENGPEIQNNFFDPRNPQAPAAAAPPPAAAADAAAPEAAPIPTIDNATVENFGKARPADLPTADPNVNPWTGMQEPPRPSPDMQAPRYSQVAEVNPQEIAVDPRRFQFKLGGQNKTGASGSLAESSGFNDELAGVISVWRDPADGVTYVVNGHNRLRLAKESGSEAVLVRYLQANTPEEARAIGALQNIAEGNGTPVDAAKFMRDTGKTAEDMAAEGINLSGPVAAKAIPLSRLPQNLFDKVATGGLELNKAIALGSEALDAQVINDVAAEAVKRKWSAEKIEQAMQEAKFAQTETQGGGLLDMLGEEWANKTSNFNQLLDIRTEAFRALREEMVALTSAAREGRRGILEAAGNVIDVAGSQAARGQAAQAVDVFNRVTGYVGPVRDLLNELAGQVKGKRTAKTVVNENLDRLRQAIDDEVNGPRLPMEEPPAAAAPEAPAAPMAAPEQAAETKALLDRALAVLPPEKRAAVQAELERRAQEPAAPTGGVEIPAAAAGRLSPNRETSAAESLLNWANSGIPGEQQAIQTLDDALELVRAKGQVLDPDKVPGLDMDAARNDKAMGRNTPATQAVADAYKRFYEVDKRGVLANYEVFQPDPNQRRLDPEFIKSFTKELTEDIRRVAGDDVAIRYQQAFEFMQRPKEHGGGNKRIMVDGYYDPIQDLIQLNGIGTRGTNILHQTAFHEAWHRVQFNFLNEQELKALNSFYSQLKLFMADPEAGRRTLIEQQAVAFQKYAYAKKTGIDPLAYMTGLSEKTLKGYKVTEEGQTKLLNLTEKFGRDLAVGGMNVLDKALDFLEKANNYLRGRGWTSIKSIFDQAYSGEMALARRDMPAAYEEAAQAGSPSYPRTTILEGMRDRTAIPLWRTVRGQENPLRGVLFSEADEVPVTTPRPDEAWATRFVDQILANRQALEDGSMTVDDLLQNNVLKVESPSGARVYLPDAPPELVEAYRAHSDLVSRPDATGIPVMTDEMIEADTAQWLEKAQYSSKAVYQNLARLSGTLGQYRENLRALRAATLLADHNNYQAGIAASRWINAVGDEATAGDLPQRAAELVAAAAAADRANRAVMSVTRPIGQLMRSLQIPRPAPGSLPFDGLPGKDVTQELEEFMVKETEVPVSQSDWVKAVSPDLEEAIRTGDFTSPKVVEELDAIALNMNQATVTDGYGQIFWRNMADIGSGAVPPRVSDFNKNLGLGAKGVLFVRNSFLLSAGETQWNNVINAAIRTFEMPFTTAAGSLMRGDVAKATNAMRMYGYIVRNITGALRLGVESFKVGRGLMDMDRSSVDFLERMAANDAQQELMAQAGGKGEWTLNTVPWVAIQDKSPIAMAQKRIWQTLNLPSRFQVAADTAFKTLVGNSFERVRTLDLGLERANEMGLRGEEAWNFAQEYSKAAVERATKDVTIEGRTILDAVMDSPHAQTAMRWATFTDDIWAEMQPRTSTYGMKLAQAKGLDGDAAQQFAMDYVANGPKLLGTSLRIDDVPFFARGFSFLPKIWQTGLDSPMAPMFAALQPFNRTPGDIVKAIARKVPGANLFVDTWWRDVFSEDYYTRARAMGDIATGGMALSVGYIAITQGSVQFSGGGPLEPQAKKRWMEIEGMQPYSYRVPVGTDENGNTIYGPWQSMRAFEPFSSILGGLADYAEISNKLTTEQRERLGASLVIDLVRAVASGQLQKSYYQGFMELYDMVTSMGNIDATPNVRNPMTRFAQRWVASLAVPFSSAMRSGRRVEDKFIRDVPASDNPNKLMGFFEETRNEIYNGLPGYSQSLPPRRNWITAEPLVLTGAWGEQFLPPESPWLSTLFQLSPTVAFKKGDPQEHAVLREMAQLSKGRGAGFIGPRVSDFTEGGRIKENRLNAYEMDEYIMAIARTPDQFGRTLLQALDETMKSPNYRAATPFADTPMGGPSEAAPTLRVAMLNQVISEFMERGRARFLEGSYGKRLRENQLSVEGANRDVQFRLKYGQDLDPKAFTEALR